MERGKEGEGVGVGVTYMGVKRKEIQHGKYYRKNQGNHGCKDVRGRVKRIQGQRYRMLREGWGD